MLFDSILPAIVAKHSITDYWETSQKYGRGNPKYISEGDAHDWWIWHDEFPFEHLQKKVPRFMSEFGFQSFPSFETVKYINQNDAIDLNTDAIKSHQKHVKGFELMEKYMGVDYKIPTSDEEYVYVSQLLQAKGIVMGIEAQRRAKPYNMGTLYWQLNDCWPAISWSSIDYFGNWKALQYKAKKTFENLFISTTYEKGKLQVHIINDNFKKYDENIIIEIMDFQGNMIWCDEKRIQIGENVSQKVAEFKIDLKKIDVKKNYLRINFSTEKSLFFFEKPKYLLLEESDIQKKIEKIKGGFLITLQSNTLQKDVFLYINTKGNFDDNFFDLESNEIKKIVFKSDKKSLNDLKIKTVNKIKDFY